jgi:DNA-binding NarL/FixJ family response regulator
MENEIRVLVVDDHEVFREGLRAVVESLPGFHVVGEADRVREAYAQLQRATFDLIIVDLLLPGMSGLALVREARRVKRRERILLLTMSSDLAAAVDALAAGVNGIVLKSDSRQILAAALEQVAKGDRYVTPALPMPALEALMQRRTRGVVAGPLAPLSVREREVFDLFVRGFDNRAVAKELCISTKTVESHRGHIFVKLNLHSMADLVRFAFSRQLASCEGTTLPDDDRPERIAG